MLRDKFRKRSQNFNRLNLQEMLSSSKETLVTQVDTIWIISTKLHSFMTGSAQRVTKLLN